MLPAIILAAGRSTRMGSTKALLPVAGRPLVATIVRTLVAAGLSDIVVVTGETHEALAAALRADAPPVMPTLVQNPAPARGQLSSLWTGMDVCVGPQTDGLLVTPVDVPLVSPDVVRTVVEAWRRTRAPIVRPAVGDRHGHPVVFDRAVFAELRAAPLDAGAKAVIRAHAADVLDVLVSDEGCLMDIDTPADYDRLTRL